MEGVVWAGCGVWAGVAGEAEEEEVCELCDEVREELLEFPSAWLCAEFELEEDDWEVVEGVVWAGCGVWAGVAGEAEELLEFPSAWLWV